MTDRRVVNGGLTLAICLGLLGWASAARAGTQDGVFAVEEAGRALCPAFVKARAEKSEAYARYVGFIEGYLTAANRYEPNTFDLTPWHNANAFALILYKHCQKEKNAKDALAMVAQKLVLAMKPFRLADFSKMVEVGAGADNALLYETVLKRAQTELSRKGLYHGEVDGKFSAETKAALTEFQRLAKLQPNGIPDAATLWVLLNP
ncbi:peptidoglycan-binding domain-containing protein [Sphingosinicella humi]|uniref:Peptidoglycan binding-like domain-containing protein n=1 Tax=Allosphingosinicella humi TaxID=2068657 RepID=A0A2U2J1C7_9SPHN|nr:peptidoglycan-binding domain-containing protein [Sphingosinicella humi]PWG02122.1 hypothetical protein DF286_03995 [Sphingosinicella humi]